MANVTGPNSRGAPMSGTVEVMLSTYNGEKYVTELLESVRAQQYPHVRLSVRDDGSSDGTVHLLEQLLRGKSHDRLSVAPTSVLPRAS